MKIIISILLASVLAVSLMGCDSTPANEESSSSGAPSANTSSELDTSDANASSQEIASSSTTSSSAEYDYQHERFNEDNTFKLDSEPNTPNAVEEIMTKAKEDCMPNNSYSVKDQEYAIEVIGKFQGKFFQDRGTMELMMYHGWILSFSDVKMVSALGDDVVQSVKYVYRGEATEQDESTQSNLKQVKEDLEDL